MRAEKTTDRKPTKRRKELPALGTAIDRAATTYFF
jgi:hypothetical protein